MTTSSNYGRNPGRMGPNVVAASDHPPIHFIRLLREHQAQRPSNFDGPELFRWIQIKAELEAARDLAIQRERGSWKQVYIPEKAAMVEVQNQQLALVDRTEEHRAFIYERLQRLAEIEAEGLGLQGYEKKKHQSRMAVRRMEVRDYCRAHGLEIPDAVAIRKGVAA